jgi:hypothetical protein
VDETLTIGQVFEKEHLDQYLAQYAKQLLMGNEEEVEYYEVQFRGMRLRLPRYKIVDQNI